MADSKREKSLCFVISPIGEPGTPERKWADGVLNGLIKPAFDETFRVERADESSDPGLITDRIINQIMDAELCVAELTHLNPNVMYELAIRHMINQPVVTMMVEGSKLPFDIKDAGTVTYDHSLAGWPEAIRKLRSTWRHLESAKNKQTNPIRRTLDLAALRSTGDSSERSIALELSRLSSEMTSVRRYMEDAGAMRIGDQLRIAGSEEWSPLRGGLEGRLSWQLSRIAERLSGVAVNAEVTIAGPHTLRCVVVTTRFREEIQLNFPFRLTGQFTDKQMMTILEAFEDHVQTLFAAVPAKVAPSVNKKD